MLQRVQEAERITELKLQRDTELQLEQEEEERQRVEQRIKDVVNVLMKHGMSADAAMEQAKQVSQGDRGREYLSNSER